MYLTNRKNIRTENISARLSSGYISDEMLENYPHRRFLDLIIFAVYEDGKSGSIYLDVRDAKKLGMTSEELIETALSNTLDTGGCFLSLLSDYLDVSGVYMEERHDGIYILTSKSRRWGSVFLYSKPVLEKLSKLTGGDFFVLPSSVHECLILPYEPDVNGDNLRRMVYVINRGELVVSDILSDSVYRYDSSRKTLLIDNSGGVC